MASSPECVTAAKCIYIYTHSHVLDIEASIVCACWINTLIRVNITLRAHVCVCVCARVPAQSRQLYMNYRYHID